MEKQRRRFTFRVGPLGLSLMAAALTAAALAAVSVADSGGSSDSAEGRDGDGDFHTLRGGPHGGGPGAMFGDLSEADRQKLEDFRRCMEDNGAPGPPAPGEIDPSDGPPKPPSEADRENLRQAWEACSDQLPEELRRAGPPMLHFRGCEPGQEERGERENQSEGSGASSSGTAA
jgi:hypothetical protein